VAPRVPLVRVGLICAAIAGTSIAAVLSEPLARAGVIALSVGAVVAMVRADRLATTSLLPRDAFSPSTLTGTGLWLVLLLSISYSPLQIYVPIFLQKLHGLDPLAAGYAVACASIGWTGAALVVAGAKDEQSDRLIVAGPILMAAGLLLVAWSMPAQPFELVIAAILMVGIGIGICWAFVAQRVMSGARPEDETAAASSVATVQQMGFALGAALAGLAANASGFGNGVERQGVIDAAIWVPASFAAAAIAAWLAALRLRTLRHATSFSSPPIGGEGG
jgi:predicted MFS family arabinose efflux permease